MNKLICLLAAGVAILLWSGSATSEKINRVTVNMKAVGWFEMDYSYGAKKLYTTVMRYDDEDVFCYISATEPGEGTSIHADVGYPSPNMQCFRKNADK